MMMSEKLRYPVVLVLVVASSILRFPRALAA
jgi:hypothetical protein